MMDRQEPQVTMPHRVKAGSHIRMMVNIVLDFSLPEHFRVMAWELLGEFHPELTVLLKRAVIAADESKIGECVLHLVDAAMIHDDRIEELFLATDILKPLREKWRRLP